MASGQIEPGITTAPKKLKTFKRRIKEITGRSRGISMERRLTDLNRYVRGWIGYFGLAQQFDEFVNLDGWIRRRIRMCYWKQWRRPRTKVRNLVRLGVTLDMAIKHAISGKSYSLAGLFVAGTRDLAEIPAANWLHIVSHGDPFAPNGPRSEWHCRSGR